MRLFAVGTFQATYFLSHLIDSVVALKMPREVTVGSNYIRPEAFS
jgi:hypothetical protein